MKKNIIVFLLVLLSIISTWFFVYVYYIQSNTNWDHHLSENLGDFAVLILEFFNIPTGIEYSGTNYVITKILSVENHGVWIGTRCNGFKMFGVFSAIILAFPYAHKHKLWYIPLGILILHTINAIRVAALTYLAVFYPGYLDFNHNITFEIIVYGSVFLLWYIFIKKFIEKSIQKNK